MVLKLKKYKFHENKSPISINDIDIKKMEVSNKFPFGKQDFIYCIISYKNDKKLDFHTYFFQKGVHIE